jgi:hypothetical protein
VTGRIPANPLNKKGEAHSDYSLEENHCTRRNAPKLHIGRSSNNGREEKNVTD